MEYDDVSSLMTFAIVFGSEIRIFTVIHCQRLFIVEN